MMYQDERQWCPGLADEIEIVTYFSDRPVVDGVEAHIISGGGIMFTLKDEDGHWDSPHYWTSEEVDEEYWMKEGAVVSKRNKRIMEVKGWR